MRLAVRETAVHVLSVVLLLLLCASASADETTLAPPPTEQQSPALAEASGIGTALGAAQRCGMPTDDLARMRKLGLERLKALAPDKESYEKATNVMGQSERYGTTEMQQPVGGCSALLMVTSGLLGKLTFVVEHADLEVPDLRRATPLENFAAWAGQLAVMASHCGARDQMVNKAAALSAKYIAQQAPSQRIRRRAEAELSEMMLQAELEDWGDQDKCKEILTTFGSFFGNLDSRLQD
jgi:hypothetical protein